MNVQSSAAQRFGVVPTRGTYSEDFLRAVFGKARPIFGGVSAEWRMDAFGRTIRFSQYGDTSPDGFGWEVDHIVPVAKGGLTVLSNLQPLHWHNNRQKSDKLPMGIGSEDFSAMSRAVTKVSDELAEHFARYGGLSGRSSS